MPVLDRAVATTIKRTSAPLATEYQHTWVSPAIAEAVTYGIDVTHLFEDDATRVNLEAVLSSEDPAFVWLNDHGASNQVRGYYAVNILVSKGASHYADNADVLAGRVCYAFACSSSKTLGPDAIAKDCACYLGYNEDFWFSYNEDVYNQYLWLYEPIEYLLTDTWAQPFFDAANQIPISLMQGKTTGVAFNDSQSVFQAAIDYWSESGAYEAPYILANLVFDKQHQSLLGDEYATVVSSPLPPPTCPDYTIQGDCEAGGCHWWGDACHTIPEPPPHEPVQFGAGLLMILLLCGGIYGYMGR